MGVANDKSIAWGITQYLAAQGAEIAFTYQGEALEKRVRPLAESIGSKIVEPCDVTDEASAIEALGLKPTLVEGSPRNFKVTLPQDVLLAELYIKGIA
jgi:enoyl-[acyl-carrier-protein] reductase (NADH)